MSYPWWRFRVTFHDGHITDYTATGLTPTDAMHELLDDFWGKDTDIGKARREHGEIKAVEYLHCDTFGLDPESDKILQAEALDRMKEVVKGVVLPMQADINRILAVEEVTAASEPEGIPYGMSEMQCRQYNTCHHCGMVDAVPGNLFCQPCLDAGATVDEVIHADDWLSNSVEEATVSSGSEGTPAQSHPVSSEPEDRLE